MEIFVRSTYEIMYMRSATGMIRSQRWWGIKWTVRWWAVSPVTEIVLRSVLEHRVAELLSNKVTTLEWQPPLIRSTTTGPSGPGSGT